MKIAEVTLLRQTGLIPRTTLCRVEEDGSYRIRLRTEGRAPNVRLLWDSGASTLPWHRRNAVVRMKARAGTEIVIDTMDAGRAPGAGTGETYSLAIGIEKL